jgi:uncharacterized protein YcfL
MDWAGPFLVEGCVLLEVTLAIYISSSWFSSKTSTLYSWFKNETSKEKDVAYKFYWI